MSGVVELIVGPSGSGKTAHLLSRYRQALQESMNRRAPGETLWLTPTKRSRQSLLATLPDATLAACISPNVFTFETFAEQILEGAGTKIEPLSETSRRLLVSQLIGELLAQKELEYFAPIAATSGFVGLVLAFISELKRNEIWPERFLDACKERSRSLPPKDRELWRIYDRYQEVLNRQNLYDTEGRFWSARDVLKQGHRTPFERLSLVVVDGFADFTHTQYEILTHLSGWAEQLLISLPAESSSRAESLRRPDLFAKPSVARERLADLFDRRMKTIEREPTAKAIDQPPALRHLAETLFTNPRVVAQADDADGIEVLGVTGQTGEIRTIAERVKRLLLGGVRPEEIVIAVRSLDDYAELFDETFSAAGIPFASPPAGSFAQSPILKSLVAVLQLEVEDWPFEGLKSLLLSNYIRPAGGAWETRTRVHAVSALRRLGISRGRETVLKGLARVAQIAASPQEPAAADIATLPVLDSDDDEPTTADAKQARLVLARNAQAAHSLLSELSAATERLRVRVPFGTWVDLLFGLAEELGIAPRANESVDPALDEQDRSIWSDFEKMLFDAAKIAQRFDDEQRPLPLREFTAGLIDLLRARGRTDNGRETGRVRVLEASDVRNLDVPYLFLAGLTEGSFPRARQDDCLYNESERRSFNAQGLTLAHRSSHSHDEMLLFYQVVTRARRRLTLSYPAVSSSGLPLFPSPYLSAIRDLFRQGALQTQSIGDLDPVPDKQSIFTSADLRLVATEEVRENRPGLFRALCEYPQSASTGRNILASVDTAVARFKTRGFTPYEGKLQLVRHASALAGLFPSDHQFSATQLEQYAYCPFRFFLANVLKIAPLETVQAATDYLARGILVHGVLAEMHRPSSGSDRAVLPTEVDAAAIVERFRELVDRELGRRFGDSELQGALREIERSLLHDWAEAYGDQWIAYRDAFAEVWETPPEARHVETAFGNAPGDTESERETRVASLVFGKGDNETRVRGRIDRVDVGLVENRPVFNVVDYKTGSPPRFDFKDVETGRSLQLALYTVAVIRHELAGRGAVPFQMGYWSLRETGYVSGLKGSKSKTPEALTTEAIEQLEQTLEELVPRLAAGIRAGDFPVSSLDDDCTGRCPYNTVCRVNQIRPLAESLDKRRNAGRDDAAGN